MIEVAPGYEPAQQALRDTAVSWKQSIAQATAENDLELATTRLEEAQSVFESDPSSPCFRCDCRTDFVRASVGQHTVAVAQQRLSDEASAAAAVQAFEEILRISPDHAAAAQGLTEISKHYGELAAQAAQTAKSPKRFVCCSGHRSTQRPA